MGGVLLTIKLVATDMDSTILNDALQISGKTKAKIVEAYKHGIEVIFATGRSYLSAHYYASFFDYNMPIIAYNGGLIKTSKSSEVLYTSKIPLAIAQEVLYEANTHGIFATAFIDDLLFCEKENDKVAIFSKAHRIPYKGIGKLYTNLPGDPNILTCVDEKAKIDKMKQLLLASPFKEKVNVTSSSPFSLEIMNKQVSKGNALANLCSILGIKQEETLAIGNSLNDLSMLKWAGVGIAMKDSDQALLEKWEHVSEYKHNQDGVYHVLEKYIG